MQTRLNALLGCRYPVIQTAMGWIADANLVAATGRAGGFGFLAGAVMTPDEVASGIQAIRAQTDAAFGVNFHMYVPQAPEIVDICISEQVRAVSYSRSPDAKTIERFKAAGILCIPTVGALKHAKRRWSWVRMPWLCRVVRAVDTRARWHPPYCFPRCAKPSQCPLLRRVVFAMETDLLRR